MLTPHKKYRQIPFSGNMIIYWGEFYTTTRECC